MKIFGKEITDECQNCGNVLECELFRKGHGIKQDCENVILPDEARREKNTTGE